MKSIKRVFAFILMIALSLSLSACKDTPNETLIGQWSVDKDGVLQMTGLTTEEYNEFKQMGVEQTVIMDFGTEGIVAITFSVAGQYVRDFLPYEVKDGKLIIDGDPADYSIKNNTLTVIQDDIRLTLTKVQQD